MDKHTVVHSESTRRLHFIFLERISESDKHTSGCWQSQGSFGSCFRAFHQNTFLWIKSLLILLVSVHYNKRPWRYDCCSQREREPKRQQRDTETLIFFLKITGQTHTNSTRQPKSGERDKQGLNTQVQVIGHRCKQSGTGQTITGTGSAGKQRTWETGTSK